MKTNLRLCSVALLAITSTLSSQSIREGYSSAVTSLPSGTGQTLVTEMGAVYFTGTDLVIRNSTSTRKLLTFSKSVFGSFTIRVAKDALLFGESSNGGIWLVPTGTGTPKLLNTLKFNYSATLYDDKWAIVSAKTGGFAAKNNDVVAINLATGALDPIAIMPGASGPVVMDPFGNLYYANSIASFPSPRGKVNIYRFGAAKVAGAFGTTTLGATDAATVFTGLDAAGSIAIDDDHDIFITDWMNSTIVEISDVQTASPQQREFASYSHANVTAASLQFVPGDHRGFGVQEFEAFQPTGGGTMWILENAFAGVSQLRLVASRRPTTSIDTTNPVPVGRMFRVKITNGAAGSQAFVALGLGIPNREVAVRLALEQTIFWADVLLSPIFLSQVSFDGHGAAQLPLYNPGFTAPLQLTVQAFFSDRAGIDIGSSQPLVITLR